MTIMNFDDFKKNPQKDSTFSFHGEIFVPCKKSCDSLNQTLYTSYKIIFRSQTFIKMNEEWKKGNINWDCEDFFALTASGKIIRFNNSEWAGFTIEK